MRYALRSPLLFLGITVALACAHGQDSFKSRSQIREWIETRKGFGTPEFEFLELDRARYYFARFIPTSGLDFCHLYTFRKSEGPWRLVRHTRLAGGCHVTIRVDAATGDILYIASTGAELDRLSSP